MEEYLIMDDGGSVTSEDMSPEMIMTYENVKLQITEEFESLLE